MSQDTCQPIREAVADSAVINHVGKKKCNLSVINMCESVSRLCPH